jgi:uncharacterized membrane protein
MYIIFTINYLLIYSGITTLLLRRDTCREKAKMSVAKIGKWSRFVEEKEALLTIGTKLKILRVHYFRGNWEIAVELGKEIN